MVIRNSQQRPCLLLGCIVNLGAVNIGGRDRLKKVGLILCTNGLQSTRVYGTTCGMLSIYLSLTKHEPTGPCAILGEIYLNVTY